MSNEITVSGRFPYRVASTFNGTKLRGVSCDGQAATIALESERYEDFWMTLHFPYEKLVELTARCYAARCYERQAQAGELFDVGPLIDAYLEANSVPPLDPRFLPGVPEGIEGT